METDDLLAVYHTPALLTESIDGLDIIPSGVYVDVTFGGGGHSREILRRLGDEGQLIAFDQDKDAMKNTIQDSRFTLVHGNFRFLKNFLRFYKVDNIDVNLSNLMPISDGVLENYTEKLTALASGAIDLNTGNVFTHTLSGDTTYSISNAVSGVAHSFTLIITQTSTVRTLTFPSSVKWQGGEIPDLSTASKTYILTFASINGGTTWFGMFGGEF